MSSGVPSDPVEADITLIDASLALVVTAWPHLADPIRRVILLLLEGNNP